MATVGAWLASYPVSAPRGGEKVYKDECMFCFNTPISDGGIYVCLSTLFAVCDNHLKLHVKKKDKTVFLHLRKIQKEVELAKEGSPPEKKPTKLAIGIEGGFDLDQNKVEYEDENSLVVTDKNGIKVEHYLIQNPQIPQNIKSCINAILSHQGAVLQDEVKAWEEKRNVSKYANSLQQLKNGVKIPPKGWKCALCDLTTNVWLNLTDGAIHCGRSYFDGSGGNDHALQYYKKTKYPLAVKLGTISAEGGDVYSYTEDDMVEDPKLIEHLKHFGINVSVLEKTDKTMTELEIEANMSLKAEWDAIQEAGEKLTPLYGPGYTGMVNLGNSCYMNSIMQTLFSIDEIRKRYAEPDATEQIFSSSNTDDPAQDLNVQMAKLGSGLISGYYSLKPVVEIEPLGVRPLMIKHLIGRGHPEFSTAHQQDVQEYLLHLFDLMEKNETETDKIQDLFKFQFEDRIECNSSNKVRYVKREDLIWGLPIPVNAATNIAEYQAYEERCADKTKERISRDSVVRLKIPMQACLDNFSAPETIDDFYSSAIKDKTKAHKITRFATFPDYLIIQLQKFTISDDWTPKKLDVSVDMLDEIDLNNPKYQSSGLQEHEEVLPEDGEENPPASEPEIDEEVIVTLVSMGFQREKCKKAVLNTHNKGVEVAMNWLIEHIDDAEDVTNLIAVDVTNLMAVVGCTEMQARKALEISNNDIEAAAERLLTGEVELDDIEIDEPATSQRSSNYRHGDGKYELFAFISHMGTSTSCGHYVCHIIKDGRWVIFNDRKVAVSVNPPKDLGYLYFYKRKTSSS